MFALCVFGGLFTLGRVYGVAMTPYRVLIPIITVATLFGAVKTGWIRSLRCNRKGWKMMMFAVAVFVFWVIYGAVLLLFLDGTAMRDGANEMISLALGFCTVLIMAAWTEYEVSLTFVFRCIKLLLALLLLMATVEMLTGNHLRGSMLSAESEWEFPHGKDTMVGHFATTVFYNVNDFSAFLAIFAPAVFWGLNRKMRWSDYLLLGGSVFFMRVLDSWITMFSLLLSLLLFSILHICRDREKRGKAFWIDLGLLWLAAAAGYFLAPPVFRAMLRAMQIGPSEMSGALATLTTQAGNEGSSLNCRMATYVTGLVNTFTRTGGLGFGPSNFIAYLEGEHSDLLLNNPHCLWVEILVQYGVVILLAYTALLVTIFVCQLKSYFRTGERQMLVLIGMDVAFVFAACSPSSFLGFPYQWLLIGLSLASVLGTKTNEEERLREN